MKSTRTRSLFISTSLIGISLLVGGWLIVDPHFVNQGYWAEFALFAVLSAVIVWSGISLGDNAITPLHAVAVLALFTQPLEAIPRITSALITGALTGHVLLMIVQQQRQNTDEERNALNALTGTLAAAILPYAAGYAVYRVLDGALPLTGDNFFPEAGAFAAAMFAILTVHALIILLQTRHPLQVIRSEGVPLLLLLLLPLPYAITGAIFATAAGSLLALLIAAIGIVVVAAGLMISVMLIRQRIDAARDHHQLTATISAVTVQTTREAVIHAVAGHIAQIITDPDIFIIRTDTGGRIMDAPDDLPRSTKIEPAIQSVLQTGQIQTIRTGGEQYITLIPIFASSYRRSIILFQHTMGMTLAPQLHNEITILMKVVNLRLQVLDALRDAHILVDQIAVYNQITPVFSLPMPADEVLDMIVSGLSAMVEAQAVSIFRYAPDGSLEMVRCAGLSVSYEDNPTQPEMARRLLASPDEPPQILMIEDAAPFHVDRRWWHLIHDEGMGAWVEIPMLYQQRITGVLVAYFRKPRTFSPPLLQLLQAFASQAESAYQRSRNATTPAQNPSAEAIDSAATRMIVHDLRSPLTAVNASLNIIARSVSEDNPAYAVINQTITVSQRSLNKLLHRINSLLEVTAVRDGEMLIERESASLIVLVDEVIADIQALANEINVRIVADIEPSLDAVNIDADRFERLVQNLLDNALKYSPAGSTITLRAYRGIGDQFTLDVMDEGPGIAPEEREKLFQPFVQGSTRSKRRDGIGLGLAYCRLVADAHDGTITILDNDDINGGTIFRVTVRGVSGAESATGTPAPYISS